MFKSLRHILINNLYMLKMIYRIKPSRIWFAVLMTIVTALIGVLSNIVLMQTVINELQKGTGFWNIFIFIVGVFVIQFLMSLITKMYETFYLPKTNIEINRELQKQFYSKTMELDLACFENPDFYNKYVIANSVLTTKADEVIQSLCGLINCITMLSSLSLVLFRIDPFIILFALVPFFYTLFFGSKINKINRNMRNEGTVLNRETDYIHRTFFLADFAKEMRMTKVSDEILKRFSSIMDKKNKLVNKYFPKFTTIMTTRFLVNASTSLGARLYAAFRAIVSKKILLGDFFIVTNSLLSVSYFLKNSIDVIQSFHSHALYVDDLKSFFDYVPKVSLNPEGLNVENNCTHISLKNVSFKYDSQLEYCLKNINMEINPKEKIAIIGNNGAGKTTLVKLIMRLYNVSEGVIYLNHENINDYNLNSYRNCFGTIFQDHRHFAFSIAENILMSEQDSSEDEKKVEEALDKSGLSEKVKSLPLGVNTSLTKEFNENGTDLSGGEYQKLSLARVFAKDCKIVILDEPSSALDPISEYNMYQNMLEICKDKTIIFISHRLSSAVIADRIYLLDNGEIVEVGSHHELMNKNGKYAGMFMRQAENYQ